MKCATNKTFNIDESDIKIAVSQSEIPGQVFLKITLLKEISFL